MTPQSTDPLSASSVSKTMAASLPRDASPQIKTPYDAIALAVHACMVVVGFRLVGLGEDDSIDSTSSSRLPAEWNHGTSYAFRYAHEQSAMQFIVKVGRLGSKAVIDAIALGDDRRTSFDIAVQDYISISSLPATPISNNDDDNNENDNATTAPPKALQDVFISPGRLGDLAALVKLNVIQKLAPGLRKAGYEDTAASSTIATAAEVSSSARPSRQPQPGYDPLRDDSLAIGGGPQRGYRVPVPRRGVLPPGMEQPPGFEDEYEILTPPHGGMPGLRNPLSIGHDDLYPPGLGPHDPLRPAFIGGGGGGMHPTFDDPLFGGSGGRGPGGGRGAGDPQVPPGARYDPVGPEDPRGGPGQFPGAGHRGPGGAPPNPFSGFGSGDFI